MSTVITSTENLARLDEPFEESEIEWRMQSAGLKNGQPWGKAVPYLSVGAIQKRLNDVCGKAGWSCETRSVPGSNANDKGGFVCSIGIWDETKGQFVRKDDGAGQTDIEQFKGGLSGAFKRAARRWGLGEYLCDCPEMWVEWHPDAPKGQKIDGQWYNWYPPKLPPEMLPANRSARPASQPAATQAAPAAQNGPPASQPTQTAPPPATTASEAFRMFWALCLKKIAGTPWTPDDLTACISDQVVLLDDWSLCRQDARGELRADLERLKKFTNPELFNLLYEIIEKEILKSQGHSKPASQPAAAAAPAGAADPVISKQYEEFREAVKMAVSRCEQAGNRIWNGNWQAAMEFVIVSARVFRDIEDMQTCVSDVRFSDAMKKIKAHQNRYAPTQEDY